MLKKSTIVILLLGILVCTCTYLDNQESLIDQVQITWEVPNDVSGGLTGKNFDQIQKAVDAFAWQDFIAINWPALPGFPGQPDTTKSIADAGPRVWETWKETSEVYLPDGRRPLPWGKSMEISGLKKGIKVLSRWSKVDEFLNDTLQPTKANGALPGTLTDQNGNLVYYEIRLNKILFDYIYQKGFYNAPVQVQAQSITAPAGSMIVKAAWRQVDSSEAPNFLVVDAYISDNPDRSKAKYQLKKMGLVGLHVMRKTPDAPQWIWSTHEQVQNVSSIHPSFYNPACKNCPVNEQTQPGTPNQVKRTTAIPLATQNLNQIVQKLLGSAKLSQYELVGAQWPVPPVNRDSIPSTVFEVVPTLLANTTMETFIQGTSSCMGCHAMARNVNPDTFISADFSFTFGDARPQLVNKVIPLPPSQNGSIYPPNQWKSIVLGYQLAANTYELLPKFVPTAKLHCGSCHLAVGTDPRAAWWVGMRAPNKYPTLKDLTQRINNCFTNSLNGVALCADTDTTNTKMNAIIDYMAWLDVQAKKVPDRPASPYPYIPQNLTGDSLRGKAIFVQKCAFCHGKDGQGRYGSNVYYRPALWGSHSFNKSAGFYAYPELMAAFIHGNMPLGSGVSLRHKKPTI
ncbi:c-type cytochrome [Haliscomenobacter hydrossis]|uniref:Cytochrome c domain-containing protein n=1 Tax=Haliscomenobacter hydrossis (strain ATCC 27775 / DSM 1100 / LMG 10767 / O) TaxID=760192 RepID=F4L1G2_HALH1|nr:hypothetical protein [Haliscomenobacter hydrossis]AEE53859.1 hypothetical protein Halhy_6036 [Haliscomenobacter hydrossis DSM 1100]